MAAELDACLEHIYENMAFNNSIPTLVLFFLIFCSILFVSNKPIQAAVIFETGSFSMLRIPWASNTMASNT